MLSTGIVSMRNAPARRQPSHAGRHRGEPRRDGAQPPHRRRRQRQAHARVPVHDQAEHEQDQQTGHHRPAPATSARGTSSRGGSPTSRSTRPGAASPPNASSAAASGAAPPLRTAAASAASSPSASSRRGNALREYASPIARARGLAAGRDAPRDGSRGRRPRPARPRRDARARPRRRTPAAATARRRRPAAARPARSSPDAPRSRARDHRHVLRDTTMRGHAARDRAEDAHERKQVEQREQDQQDAANLDLTVGHALQRVPRARRRGSAWRPGRRSGRAATR